MLLTKNPLSTPSKENLDNASKYVVFAQHVRGPADEPMPYSHKDWKVKAEVNDPLGYRARVYTNGQEYVVAFRGTQSLKELILMDSQIAIGVLPDVHSKIDPLLSGIPIDKVTFVGHSLGSTLASAMSADFHRPAWVYESPGVPGYSANQLSQVTAFQSAMINIVDSLPYAKAPDENLFEIPLPAETVQAMITRNDYMLRLNASNIVTNDATKIIRVVADLTNRVVSLGDVHSIDTMSTALQELSALKYPQDINSGQSNGEYSMQVLLHAQRTLSYSQQLIGEKPSSDNSNHTREQDFLANKNAALRSLSDTQDSIYTYKNCYKIEKDSIEEKLLNETSAQLEKLKTQIERANTDKDIASIEKDLKKSNQELSKLINGKGVSLNGKNASLKSVTSSAFEKLASIDKESIKLGMDILSAFGLKITQDERTFTSATLVMIASLGRNYQISKNPDEENNDFFANSLTTLDMYFTQLSDLGEVFGDINVATVGKMGSNAIEIVRELTVLTSMETFGLAAINPTLLIAANAVSFFSMFANGFLSQDSNEAEAEAFFQLSQQIADLYDLVARSSEQIFENQKRMMAAISRAFAEIEANFKTPVMKGLENIQEALANLRYELNSNFKHLFLSEFTALIHRADKIIEGHFDSDIEYKKHKALSTSEKLLGWVNQQAGQPIITGLIHKVSDDKKLALKELNTLLAENDLDSILAYFVLFLQKFYPATHQLNLNANEIININTWTLAVSNYLKLLEVDETILIDYSLKQLQSIYQKAVTLIQAINNLRNNEALQDSIAADYLSILKELIQNIQRQFLELNPRNYQTNSTSFSTLFPENSGALTMINEQAQVLDGQEKVIYALSELAGLTESTIFEAPTLPKFKSFLAIDIPRHFSTSSSLLSSPATQINITHTVTFYENKTPKIAVLIQDSSGIRVNIYDPKEKTWRIGKPTSKDTGYSYQASSVQAFMPYTKEGESKLYAILLATTLKNIIALAEYDYINDVWIYHKRLNLPQPIFWQRQSLQPNMAIGDYLINKKPLEAFCFNDADKIAVAMMLANDPLPISEAIFLNVYTFDLKNITMEPKRILQAPSLSAVDKHYNNYNVAASLSAAAGKKDIYFYNIAYMTLNPMAAAVVKAFTIDVKTGVLLYIEKNIANVPRYERMGFSPLHVLITEVNGNETMFTLAAHLQSMNSATGLEIACYDNNNGWQKLPELTDNRLPAAIEEYTYIFSEPHLVNIGGKNYIALLHQDEVNIKIWLYDISAGTWIRNQQESRYSELGPDWKINTGIIHATTSSNFFQNDSQTLISFTRSNTTQIEIENFSLAPPAEVLLQNAPQILQKWKTNMRDTKPHLVTQSKENNSVENKNFYIETPPVTHREYGFSSLEIRPAQIVNINLESNETRALLGNEISLVLQAAYLNRATKNDSNFWRWLITKENPLTLIYQAEDLLDDLYVATSDLEKNYEKVLREAELLNPQNTVFKKRNDLINENMVINDPNKALQSLYLKRIEQLMEWLKNTANDAESIKQQKEQWSKELESAQQNRQKYMNEWIAFCSEKQICELYLQEGLSKDLPLGWRSAIAYLSQDPDNSIAICHINYEENKFNILTTYNNDSSNDNDYKFYVIPNDDDYVFNLLHSSENVDMSLLPPKCAGRLDVALRGTTFALQRSIHTSEEKKAAKIENKLGDNANSHMTRHMLVRKFDSSRKTKSVQETSRFKVEVSSESIIGGKKGLSA